MIRLSLGFSPCPNDTFIFDALANMKVETEGITFDVVMEDVETLNNLALRGGLDITKISYGVLPLVLDKFILLNSGSALGRGVGPLLISKKEPAHLSGRQEIRKIEESSIAIPGEHTTAHLLFSLAYPGAKNKIFLKYDKIEDFVLSGRGLGVIIHENRFTYQDKGLNKITDLGDHWEQETGNPIPLGGIVIKRDHNAGLQNKIDRLIRRSIAYAHSNYPELNDFILFNAQEMTEDIIRKHIDLYVNNFSIELGEEGRSAVKKLLEVYGEIHGSKFGSENIFSN